MGTPNTSSANVKIFELHQYFIVGNDDFANTNYFISRNLQTAEKEAREYLSDDWGEEVARKWSLKNTRVRDVEGRSIYATLTQVHDLYTHLGIEEARPRFSSKYGIYLVVSDSVESCFYNEATDSCMDPTCLTIITEVAATSEKQAVKKARVEFGIPEWVNLFCYDFLS